MRSRPRLADGLQLCLSVGSAFSNCETQLAPVNRAARYDCLLHSPGIRGNRDSGRREFFPKFGRHRRHRYFFFPCPPAVAGRAADARLSCSDFSKGQIVTPAIAGRYDLESVFFNRGDSGQRTRCRGSRGPGTRRRRSSTGCGTTRSPPRSPQKTRSRRRCPRCRTRRTSSRQERH